MAEIEKGGELRHPPPDWLIHSNLSFSPWLLDPSLHKNSWWDLIFFLLTFNRKFLNGQKTIEKTKNFFERSCQFNQQELFVRKCFLKYFCSNSFCGKEMIKRLLVKCWWNWLKKGFMPTIECWQVTAMKNRILHFSLVLRFNEHFTFSLSHFLANLDYYLSLFSSSFSES